MGKKVLIFISSYNAERTIDRVLSRIPAEIFTDARFNAEILLIDDCSQDSTLAHGLSYNCLHREMPLKVLANPINLGHGGNQKLGYRYALENNFDFVALLHGDGKYAPEELPQLLEPLLEGSADAVYGSRLISPRAALLAGMPRYKYFGNRIISKLQNWIVGASLSEWHSGYRVFSVSALKEIPFEKNSDGFEFDTDITIQLKLKSKRIKEVEVSTFYGDDIRKANGVAYGLKVLGHCIKSRLQKVGILYDPKYDLNVENQQYKAKFDFLSSHSVALSRIAEADSTLILGCGPAELVKPFASKSSEVSVVDLFVDSSLEEICDKAFSADIESFKFSRFGKKTFSKVLALDVIEHLKEPEKLLERMRNSKPTCNAELLITVPNVAFLPIRVMLAFGSFNYGKRGILDLTHTRLFTSKSLRMMLQQNGYEVEEFVGIPAPFPLAFGRNALSGLLLKLNQLAISVFPSLFAYQLYVRAKPLPTPAMLLERAGDRVKTLQEDESKSQAEFVVPTELH